MKLKTIESSIHSQLKAVTKKNKQRSMCISNIRISQITNVTVMEKIVHEIST